MTLPWRVGTVVSLYLATVVGGALLVAGWYGASGTGDVAAQLVWLNVAALGLIVAGTGNVVWLLYGHRSVRARQRALVARGMELAAPPRRPTASPTSTTPTALRVAIHGGARFHRPTCPLVVGKRTTARIGTKRIPCEACRP